MPVEVPGWSNENEIQSGKGKAAERPKPLFKVGKGSGILDENGVRLFDYTII